MRRLLPLALLCALLGMMTVSCSKTEEQKRVQIQFDHLKEFDVDVYYTAIDSLVAMEQDAVEPCIRALKNKNVGIRCGAVEVLGRIGDRAAVKPLIKKLGDRDGFMVLEGYRPLYKIAVNYNAAIALGRLGDPRAVKPLLKRLRDRDGSMREHVAGTFGDFGDKSAVKALVESMRDRNPGVRYSASGSLYRLTGQDFSDNNHEPWEKWYEETREAGF